MDRKQVLQEAEKCVCQSRQEEYGPIEDNFNIIAGFWSTYLGERIVSKIDAEDVAIMMCLLKVARISTGTFKDDSYVDLAGYAACAGEIASNAHNNSSE